MASKENLSHDLAISAATIVGLRDFEKEIPSGCSPDEARSRFADFLLDEYRFFNDYYMNKLK